MDKKILSFSNNNLLEKLTIDNEDSNKESFINIINEHGVVVLRNALNKNNLKNLLNQYKETFEIENNPYICPQGVNAPPNVTNLWPDFINDKHVIKILNDLKESIIGKELFNFFNDKYFTCKKAVMSTHRTNPTDKALKFMNWHQDNASMGWSEDIRALTVWCPLTSTGPDDSPGLRVCANKFDKNIMDYTGDTHEWDKFLNNYSNKIILPKTQPGDCIIFNNFTMHGTGFTLSQTNTRYSLDFRLLNTKKHPPVNNDEKIFVYPFKKPELYGEYFNLQKNQSFLKKFLKKIFK